MIINHVERVEAPATLDGSEGLLAIFVYNHNPEPGARFFTDPSLGLQVGELRYPSGHSVPAHHHLPARRPVTVTQEVILVQRGILRVRVYSLSQEMVAERFLRAGDMVILVAGGHSFECLGEVNMLEVKMGPYQGKVYDKEMW